MGTTKNGAHGASNATLDRHAAIAALGRRVHDTRAARGYSLQEFAHLAGISAPALSALERGEAVTPISVLFAAADALEVPVGAFFAPQTPAPAAAQPAASAPPAPTRPAPSAAHAQPAPSAPRAPSRPAASAEPAPHGYIPLEMPDLWEPPVGTPEDQPAFARPSRASEPEPFPAWEEPVYAVRPRAAAPQQAPAFEPTAPVSVTVPVMPVAAPDPVPQAPPTYAAPVAAPAYAPPVAAPAYAAPASVSHAHPATAHRAPAYAAPAAVAVGGGYAPAYPAAHLVSVPPPRTFADLRVGVLAERSFETLPQFAVAAVVEAGHPVTVVASIFRVPTWRLEGWVRDGAPVPAGAKPVRRIR